MKLKAILKKRWWILVGEGPDGDVALDTDSPDNEDAAPVLYPTQKHAKAWCEPGEKPVALRLVLDKEGKR